ncbi:Uncharacterised protein [Escherichia coli]|uniref:Uncharacterized protein n=1 Tax=Escherichia coli TaxID=562 RepID=A0A376P3H9_ECOLX|nr:Uncharacterised protein [Escherichia coli]
MQRKVNRSDSDYHYGKEKYKRNVYKMMLKCKQREVMPGDINDYSRYKDGIVYNEPCVLAGCRVNAVSSRQNRPDSIHQNFHVKLITGVSSNFVHPRLSNLTFCPEHKNSAGVGGVKIAETFPEGRGSPHGCGLRARLTGRYSRPTR